MSKINKLSQALENCYSGSKTCNVILRQPNRSIIKQIKLHDGKEIVKYFASSEFEDKTINYIKSCVSQFETAMGDGTTLFSLLLTELIRHGKKISDNDLGEILHYLDKSKEEPNSSNLRLWTRTVLGNSRIANDLCNNLIKKDANELYISKVEKISSIGNPYEIYQENGLEANGSVINSYNFLKNTVVNKPIVVFKEHLNQETLDKLILTNCLIVCISYDQEIYSTLKSLRMSKAMVFKTDKENFSDIKAFSTKLEENKGETLYTITSLIFVDSSTIIVENKLRDLEHLNNYCNNLLESSTPDTEDFIQDRVNAISSAIYNAIYVRNDQFFYAVEDLHKSYKHFIRNGVVKGALGWLEHSSSRLGIILSDIKALIKSKDCNFFEEARDGYKVIEQAIIVACDKANEYLNVGFDIDANYHETI